MNLQTALFTVMVNLLLTKELTSQAEKYGSGPTIMESTDLTMFPYQSEAAVLVERQNGLSKTQLQPV